jgi:formylglycine-generating enzyme required for sulfatase activity
VVWSQDRANAEEKIGHPFAVGMYPRGRNPLELHDLGGNVLEWTRSVYRAYPYDPARAEKATPDADDRLVLRGGSWIDSTRLVRCTDRYGDFPDLYDYFIGFRVVVSLASEN